jgi:hypothetical protein
MIEVDYPNDTRAAAVSSSIDESADATGQTRIKSPTWQQTLFAAKAAYNSGRKNHALHLYKAGLENADRALDDDKELIAFLQKHVCEVGPDHRANFLIT